MNKDCKNPIRLMRMYDCSNKAIRRRLKKSKRLRGNSDMEYAFEGIDMFVEVLKSRMEAEKNV